MIPSVRSPIEVAPDEEELRRFLDEGGYDEGIEEETEDAGRRGHQTVRAYLERGRGYDGEEAVKHAPPEEADGLGPLPIEAVEIGEDEGRGQRGHPER
jgi:hypothetical protein